MSFGDKRDATLIRNTDSMHFIMGVLLPNRADNEAFIRETFDLTKLNAYLSKKCQEDPEYKYNVFQFIVSAFLKCAVLRPKLNRFYRNGNYYQRKALTAAFVIKKKFEDHSEEGFCFLNADPSWTIDNVHKEIHRQVTEVRGGKDDDSTEAMNLFNKIPRFISKTGVKFVCWLDKHGWAPQSMIATDPQQASIFFTNLGSIKLDAGYHHLTNWGTTSLFCTVGFKKPRPFYKEDGSVEMKDSIEIGLTVDERIADGYYFSKTIQLLKVIFENPELLDKPFSEEVDF